MLVVEDIELLKNRTIKAIVTDHEEFIIFVLGDNGVVMMNHGQNCCETVHIEDIVSDLNNLLDKPLVRAEVKSTGNIDIAGGDEEWTFYTLATINGYVDIKWYGTSNGYYSTAVYVESKSVETITRYLESYIRYEKNYDEKLKVFTNSTNPVINFDTKLLN